MTELFPLNVNPLIFGKNDLENTIKHSLYHEFCIIDPCNLKDTVFIRL